MPGIGASLMRKLVSIAWLFSALPALAQDATGIDLSQPPPPQKSGDETVVMPPIDLSKEPEPATPAKPEAAAPAPVAPFGEKDVALGDKVKSVQRKGFLKKGRFEAEPLFAATMNDAFYQKFGGGLRIAYNFGETFALSLRGVTYRKPEWSSPSGWQPAPVRTDFAREGKIAFGGQLLASQIYDQLMLDGIWSPIYGKISVLGASIVHFDVYLAGGFGLVWTATSYAPRDNAGLGPAPGTVVVGRSKLGVDLGGGVRFYPKDWLALDAGLMATLYPDQPVASLPATIQRVFAVNLGVAFFFPFSFDYVYP
jgi:outer membrane beta-barrel protein